MSNIPPEVQAAAIKAASDWTLFLTPKPVYGRIGFGKVKDSEKELLKNFKAAYKDIVDFASPYTGG
jgi:hypothetical protein